MKRFRLATIAGLCLTGLSLGACNSNDEATDGQVTIEYFNQKPEMSDTVEEMVNDFEAENPEIHVKFVNVPSSGEVLKTRVLAGDLPDVMNVYPHSVEAQEWGKAGYFEDLTNEAYVDNIKHNYADKFSIDGKIYNIPLTANVYGFFYNKTAFEELGLEIPDTWAEFEALVADIQGAGETPFAIAGSEGWTMNGFHQLALSTVSGGEDEANDLVRFSPVNGIEVNDPRIQKDFNRLDLLRREGAQQRNWKGAAYYDAVVSFANADALIMPNGSWVLPVINQQEPDFEVATFPFPSEEPGGSLTIGSGDLALSISATSKHKEAAHKFVNYMTTPEPMQKYYDADGAPCAVKGVNEDTLDSPLGGLAELAFTDRHLVMLSQEWVSDSDFYTLTANYLTSGNEDEMVRAMNAFFNPMKTDVE